MSIPQNSQNYELDVKRHSFAHLMAATVGQMFPEAQFGVGPVIENGCYYDFILPRTLIPEDLPLIENKIKEMLKQPLVFKVQEMELPDAIALFEKMNQPLKVELLNDLATRGTTSMSEEERADFNIPPTSLKGGEENSRLFFALNSIGKRPFNFGIVNYNKELKDRAQELRNNQTASEKIFWDKIRKNSKLSQLTWNRQKPVGRFIADFYCRELNLLIEIDGSSHDEKEGYDFERDNTIKSQSLEILRFKNEEIENNINKVLENIYNWSLQKSPFYGPKTHIINSPLSRGIEGDVKITIYRLENEKTGEDLFVDLCKGPHIKGFREMRNLGFSLDKFSGSYWRGDQDRNIQMQRIYALVFDTKEKLKEFEEKRKLAQERDHRKLGVQAEWFYFDETAPGMPYFLPKGLIIKNKLIEFWRQDHSKRGYQEYSSPLISKQTLFETSGHWEHYRDDMMITKSKGEEIEWGIKAMSCPNACSVYAFRPRSYKDLPLRFSDLDTLHRNENPGSLNGLFRVRSFNQDDSHNFIRPDQVELEINNILDIIYDFYKLFNLENKIKLYLSTMPDDHLGEEEDWRKAENIIEGLLTKSDFDYGIKDKDGAFYGPKIDIHLTDALGRDWQCGTVQLDYQLPSRFNLTYTNENGEKEVPVIIHRVIYGSLDRFLGILIEHTGGWLPFWLSPEQVRILTINDQVLPYVEKIKEILDETVLMKPLKYNEIRYEVDDRNESLGKKIREATKSKIPVQLIVGPKDIEAGEVSVRTQNGEEKVKLEDLREFLRNVK